MRILVASDTPLDSIRAHTINVLKTAGGFQRLGHQVVGCVRAPESEAPSVALAGLGESALPCWLAGPDIARSDRDAGQAFANWALRLAGEFRPEVVYARHFQAAILASEIGYNTVLETHAYVGDTNPALLAALRATQTLNLSIMTISPRLADYYVAQGANPQRIRVVPDGVDTALFARSEAIGKSPFSGDGTHVLYAGHLYDYKGIPDILDAADKLPSTQFHLLGGLDEDIDRTRSAIAHRKLQTVTVHGRVPLTRVPPFLWHADALLLPPSAQEPSKDWTSPVKLGEYLASSTPIVCTDIPALRDWLPADLVEWASPDNGSSLAAAITRSLQLSDKVQADRVCRSTELARSLSYPHRARAALHAAVGQQAQPLRAAA